MAIRITSTFEQEIASSTGVSTREATPEEGRAILDRAARRHLKMTGPEFVAAWKAGKFTDTDRPEVVRVAMLLPFAD
jgi:hypothetical protein